jgi:hypothetical protein
MQGARIARSQAVYSYVGGTTVKKLITQVGGAKTVLLEKITVSERVKNFPAFYGKRRFITVFTAAHQ